MEEKDNLCNKIMKLKMIEYQVDKSMMGPEWDSEEDDLTAFCKILQDLCEEYCLFFTIKEITSSVNGATNVYEDADYALWRYDHLGVFPLYDFMWESIPWYNALEVYWLDQKDNSLHSFGKGQNWEDQDDEYMGSLDDMIEIIYKAYQSEDIIELESD